MGSLDWKPVHGTRARQIYDDAQRARRKPCRCGSGLRKLAMKLTCIACDPETRDRFRNMKGLTDDHS